MNPSETEFRATGRAIPQRQRLLDYLVERPGEWVPMVEIAALLSTYAVHSRIADVRRILESEGRGTVRNQQRVDPETRQRLSWYLYAPTPTP